MPAEKPTIPKGTRDFTPAEMVRRNYIFRTIRDIFERYGYEPIETPAMENLSTLLGKYGEEGDKLLFRILNSGNFLSGLDREELAEENLPGVMSHVAEKGLRYDLTVPFARFVVQHLNEITFPFKRYQMQPVWRADKPQKGRYREFYQCDVDVIGSTGLLNEVELIQIITDVFRDLNIRVVTRLNNRKILAGIAEHCGIPDRFTDMTTGLDKLEKIGKDKVFEELKEREIPEKALVKLDPFLDLRGSAEEMLSELTRTLGDSAVGILGVKEMQVIFSHLRLLGLGADCELDLSLARGLNYYTGTIIEVTGREARIGSLCGGGRYDDLTGIFGLDGVSGVGISFGAERIYDVLLEQGLFPDDDRSVSRVLFINFGEREAAYCLPMAKELRSRGINAEVFPESSKLKKQMKYADQKKIPFVVLAGEDEIRANTFTVKNMATGDQKTLSGEELAGLLSS